MSDIRIAAQLYTLREFMKTPEGIAGTLKRVKEIGYDAVQVSGMGHIDRGKAELIKKTTEELGLTICATHVGFDELENDMDWMIELHKMWDSRYVGLGAMPERFRKNKEGFVEFARIASGFGRTLNENGLRFIYHNHDFEFHKFDGATGMEILFSETDPECFDFEIDTYWVQAGGADPIWWIRKMKGRMEVIHFKDMMMYQGKQAMAEVGEGNLNWQGIIDACRETGVRWAAVEQDICMRDPFESLRISLKNLEKFGVGPDA